MRIDHVEVCNFRNYEKAKLDFHEHINVLYGDNAQGKTNILESLFVSGTTKSHKGSKDRELIRIGEDEAHIRVLLTKMIFLIRLTCICVKASQRELQLTAFLSGVPVSLWD